MKIPSEVQCKSCSQVFCCAKCRQKHEDNNHQELKAIRQICYICNNRPFPLRTDTKITPGNVLVEHILKEHLPLRCNRCSKVFHTAADFRSIARCLNTDHKKDPACATSVCHLEHNPAIPTILETAAESFNGQSFSDENKENVEESFSTGSSDRSSQAATMGPPTAIKMKVPSVLAETPQPISKELRAITDPIESVGDVNEAMLTPLSMINLRWKRKSRQSFDSMLSTTNNISAVNASEGAVMVPSSPSKKLVRTTSTPMMHGCLPQHLKGVNESYTCAMGQMSSIHSNSSSESDSRANDTPNSPTNYEINKVRAIIRSRSKVAATPLRQVMSKSIQRAIAQHGYARMLAPGTQRKMSFSSSTGSISGISSTNGSPSRVALDLRTTPVLKRTSSEGNTGSRTAKLVRLEPKSQSEDSGGSTLDDASGFDYYDAHQNAESLNSTVEQENRDNHKLLQESFAFVQPNIPKPLPICYNETPKVAGGILKKVISFTPDITRHSSDDLEESSDVWATPSAIPTRSYSCSALKEFRADSVTTEVNSDSSDDVFSAPVVRSKSCKQLKLDSPTPAVSTGRLWTIVSSVIRLASRSDIREELAATENSSGSDSDAKFSAATLAKKAASFAGFLRNRLPGTVVSNRHSSSDEFSPGPSSNGTTKRRRTTSIYARPYESIGKTATVLRTSSSPLAKRKRIQGRQPIERMRRNSSRSGSGSDF